MIFRTMDEAQRAPGPGVSWRHRVFVPVTLPDGRRYVRAYEFDAIRHQCRRCRNALGKQSRRPHGQPCSRERSRSTGYVCPSCGNPYAGFVRRLVKRCGETFAELPTVWGGGGRLH